MTARLADAPQHAVVHALLLQAVEMAAQICAHPCLAAEANAAQHRAAQATEQALNVLIHAARPARWQSFTRSDAEVIEAARQARPAAPLCDAEQVRRAVAEVGLKPPPGRPA